MYLAIDIGGTFIKYSTMTIDAQILYKNQIPAPHTGLNDMKEALFSIIDEQLTPDIKGIAISCPGTIDVQTGIIYNGGSFPFLHEVNFVDMIEDHYHIPVSIENDAKCAALAELWSGSIKDCQNAIVMVLGTAVGGAIIIDGKLYGGANLSAGELSYMMDLFNDETMEADFFSRTGSAVETMKEIAKQLYLNESDGQKVFEMINAGNKAANEIFNKYCSRIAKQILNLQYIIDPEKIAIGGGISAQPILLERLKQAINRIKAENPIHTANPNIVICQFNNDSNMIGALYHFITSSQKNF